MSEILAYIVLLFLHGLAVILNLITMVAFIVNRKLRKTQNIFVCNIALADCISSFLVILTFEQTFLEGRNIAEVYLIYRSTCITGICSTLAVAIHRFIVIRFDPFNKRHLVTAPRCIIICVIFWAIPSIVFLNIDMNVRIDIFVLPAVTVGSHSLCAVCYVVVYSTIAGAARKAGLSGEVLVQRIKQNKKILITFAIIMGTNLFCAPYCVLLFIGYTRSDWVTVKVGIYLDYAFWYKVVENIALCLLGFNACLNPIIYWTRLTEFRRLLGGLRCCKASNADDEISRNSKSTSNDESSFQTKESSVAARGDGKISGKPNIYNVHI